MIKIDEITEIEIKDGILTISQFDNNEVILTQDNLKKLLKAINYTHSCTELKAIEDLKDFAYNNCQLHNTEQLDEIIERL